MWKNLNCSKGALDLRHLAAREARGKEFVQQLMNKSQVYVQVTRGLADLHSELLRYQIDTGSNGNALLGYSLAKFRK